MTPLQFLARGEQHRQQIGNHDLHFLSVEQPHVLDSQSPTPSSQRSLEMPGQGRFACDTTLRLLLFPC